MAGNIPASLERSGVTALRVFAADPLANNTTHGARQRRPAPGQRPRPLPRLNEHARGFFALLGLGGGEHGHEGLAEGAFGKQTRKQIGNAKATLKASVSAISAKDQTMSRSRAAPREASVSKGTVEAAEQYHGARCMRCARSARTGQRRRTPPWLSGL